jgi:hypothetical protein
VGTKIDGVIRKRLDKKQAVLKVAKTLGVGVSTVRCASASEFDTQTPVCRIVLIHGYVFRPRKARAVP